MRTTAAVLIVLSCASLAMAGTEPAPAAPGARTVAAPCPDCPPQVIRDYTYQDQERIIQVPRTIEHHIIPRITERVEYVETEVTITDPEQVICACPEQPAPMVAAPMMIDTGHAHPPEIRSVDVPHRARGFARFRLRRAAKKHNRAADRINRDSGHVHHSYPVYQGIGY